MTPIVELPKNTTERSRVQPKALSRKSIPEDALELAPKLRPEDVAEIYAGSGHSPIEALQVALAGTECFSIVDASDGHVIGMYGLNFMPELGEGQACVWMLASDDLVRVKDDFISGTPAVLRRWHHHYGVLWNIIDQRQTMHIRWLKRLGFRFTKQLEAYGHEQRPFYQFVRHAPVESEVTHV